MQLEGYSDLTRLTKGGMATLYKAQQESLNRTVVIKFLSAEFMWDDQVKKFFDQESLVIARLNHPNIIHIIDRGITPKGRPFFVMEYVQGRDLAEIMKQQKLSPVEGLQILMQVCKGMGFAHKNGVIHRDIKPANILLDKENHVYILDFGIAWLESSGQPDVEQVVGTPDYMSPEQFSAPDSVTHSSDIYSLGAVMFQVFTGKLPTAQMNDLSSALKSIPKSLAELIVQCLNVDPLLRSVSVDEIQFQLLKILKGAHLDQQQKADAQAAIGKAAQNFELLDVINRNRFGAAYLFEDKARKKMIVVKKRVNSIDGYEQARKLRHLQHLNIIHVMGTSKKDKTFIVVMEYLTGGSLQDRLSRPFTPVRFVEVATALCQALQIAHQNHIVHGNLRPSNILFDDHDQIKLTDFGFENHYLKQQQKSDWYHPIQTARGSVNEDILSAGLIFYQMLIGSSAKISNGLLKSHKKFDALDPAIQHLIKGMLFTNQPDGYKSISEIIPFLSRIHSQINIQIKPLKKFKFWHFILILLVMNLVGVALLYQYNPEFNQFVTKVINHR